MNSNEPSMLREFVRYIETGDTQVVRERLLQNARLGSTVISFGQTALHVDASIQDDRGTLLEEAQSIAPNEVVKVIQQSLSTNN